MTELKPCPFCGSKPTLQIFKGKDGWRDRYNVLCRYDEGGCGAEGGLYHSEIEAVEAWNRRTEGVTDDLISRQAAIEEVEFGITYVKAFDIETGKVRELFKASNEELKKAVERIKALPTTEPRIGKWIKGMLSPWSFANCSECGELCLNPERAKYCPNCGAKMEKNND